MRNQIWNKLHYITQRIRNSFPAMTICWWRHHSYRLTSFLKLKLYIMYLKTLALGKRFKSKKLPSKHFSVVSMLFLGWYDVTISRNFKSILKQYCVRQRRTSFVYFNVDFDIVRQCRNTIVNMTINWLDKIKIKTIKTLNKNHLTLLWWMSLSCRNRPINLRYIWVKLKILDSKSSF